MRTSKSEQRPIPSGKAPSRKGAGGAFEALADEQAAGQHYASALGHNLGRYDVVAPGSAAPPRSSVRTNATGMPDQLKVGLEALSGMSMDDVRVHRHSSKPAQLQALAYTRGTDIYLASGNECHLPHEAWHVVQQKRGRVPPTMTIRGVSINADPSLERDADLMGSRAASHSAQSVAVAPRIHDERDARDARTAGSVQRYAEVRTANGSDVKVSDKGHYVTHIDDQSIMYALNDHVLKATPPISSVASGHNLTVAGVSYDGYQPSLKVMEDCAAAMEEVMAGKKFKPDAKRTLSVFTPQVDGASLPFGQDHESNQKYGQRTAVDTAANPEVGQGFVIVRHNGKEGHPYHGAAVVAKDGSDHVTLETSAPPRGESNARVDPVYDMYGMKNGVSFFTRYAKERQRGDSDDDAQSRYGKDATVSVVKIRDRLPRGMEEE